MTPPHTARGARRTRDGRTDTTVTIVTALVRHGHAVRKPTRWRTAHECCKHAGSTPGQPSQRPVYGSVLHSRAPAPGQSNAERGSSAQPGRSVGLVGERRPARCFAGSTATASSLTSPALAMGGGAALPQPVRPLEVGTSSDLAVGQSVLAIGDPCLPFHLT